MGLEAISRGCKEVHFVEMDPWVVSAVLRKNIEEFNSADQTLIRTMVLTIFFIFLSHSFLVVESGRFFG